MPDSPETQDWFTGGMGFGRLPRPCIQPVETQASPDHTQSPGGPPELQSYFEVCDASTNLQHASRRPFKKYRHRPLTEPLIALVK